MSKKERVVARSSAKAESKAMTFGIWDIDIYSKRLSNETITTVYLLNTFPKLYPHPPLISGQGEI